MKMSLKMTLQGFRRAVDRWGGRGGQGGAFERIGEARGWRWPRGSSSVAAAPFGRGREREQRGIGTEGEIRESERVRGAAWRLQGVVEASREAGGGRGAWPRAPGACPSSWQRRKRTKEEEVGWAALGRSCWATR